MALNAPSLEKFGPAVRENGIVVYDSSVIREVPTLPRGVRVHGVPCAEIAKHLGKPVVKNVVAVGAIHEAANLFVPDTFLTAIRIALAERCAMIPVNEEAFRWGAKAVREGITEFHD
jgi:Pyruvate/2-oxoacid:ferredoxin oxidoreductase gamma subunit